MGPVGHLEIVDRRGRVERRFPLVSLPAVVGRSLDCDVIIDDPFVCRAHLRIEEGKDGALEAVDLGSLNGTRIRESHRAQTRIPLEPDTVLRVGRTYLQVRRPHAAVADTKRDVRRGAAAVWRSHLGALLVVALAAGGLVVQSYLAHYERFTAADLGSSALWVLAVLGAWAGVWALANRIIRGDFRFATHWAIACVTALSLWILVDVMDVMWFLFSLDELPMAVTSFLFTLIGTGVLVAHVSVFSQMPALRRIGACALAVVPLVAAIEFTSYAAGQRFDAQLRYSGEIAPVGADWAPALSPSRYYGQLDAIRAQVDALATENEG